MEKARDFILKIIRLISKPEMRILPGQLAFFLVITIFPMLALVATIAAALSISTESIRVAISASIPSGIASVLNEIIAGNGINFNLIIFYFSAFLLASNGTYSMISISNEIYKIQPKNIIYRRLKAIVMIFIIVGLVLLLFAVPVFGGTISNIIVQLTGNSSIVKQVGKVLLIIKYPILIFLLFINIKLMYIISPDEEIESNTTNKGAIFTSLGWILSTEIFAFYIEKFGRYDMFYGSISNIIVLLLWIYLLSYIFVFGMVINAGGLEEESK